MTWRLPPKITAITTLLPPLPLVCPHGTTEMLLLILLHADLLCFSIFFLPHCWILLLHTKQLSCVTGNVARTMYRTMKGRGTGQVRPGSCFCRAKRARGMMMATKNWRMMIMMLKKQLHLILDHAYQLSVLRKHQK